MHDHNNQTVETISTQAENKPNSTTVEQKIADRETKQPNRVNEQKKQTEKEKNMTGEKTLFEFQPWMNLVIKFPEGKDDISIIAGDWEYKAHLIRKPCYSPQDFKDDNGIETSYRYYIGVEEKEFKGASFDVIVVALSKLLVSRYCILEWKSERDYYEDESLEDFYPDWETYQAEHLLLPLGGRNGLKFFFNNLSEIKELQKCNSSFIEGLTTNFIAQFILDKLPIGLSIKEKIFSDLLTRCEFPRMKTEFSKPYYFSVGRHSDRISMLERSCLKTVVSTQKS